MPNGGCRAYVPKPTYGYKTKAAKSARYEYMGLYSKALGNIKVHRAVCEAFHGPPPHARSVVIHIDENALNIRPEKLKWGKQKENLNMPGFIAYCKGRTGLKSPFIKGRMKKQQALNQAEAT
jgi:hypothetical protein